MNDSLIQKYNVPGPRYTSYPTVPYWDEEHFSKDGWQTSIQQSFQEFGKKEGIGLYIHLPFCESLCTFCGCNKRITKNHGVETPYLEAILKEWNLYLDQLDEKPMIADITLGGGTPTFFSPENLRYLIEGLFKGASRKPGSSFSFEGHPNNTTREHFQTLYDLGFRRVSFGIQDFDPTVQKIINRVQTYEQVKAVTDMAREIGYEAVNYDIIFGLPLQQLSSITDTIEKVRELKPDRIAYYSYAHVPWIKGVGQRKFSEKDLPKDEEKRELYEVGRQMLEDTGYKEIGMDHFALPHDELYKATQNNTLHRNFMGYIPFTTNMLLGLGVSAIGDTWFSFGQNIKKVEDYYAALERNEIPVFRGHLENEEDLYLRKKILDLMCQFETKWTPGEEAKNPVLKEALSRLKEPLEDGLAELEAGRLSITPKGRPFIRNVCMAFDARMWRDKPESRIFSMTV